MASDQTVSLKIVGDSTELRKALDQSAKSMDALAGTGRNVGAEIDQVLSGITTSGNAVDQTIRGIDSRLGSLSGADREVFLRANVGQAEAAIREIDRMLTDPRLTDPEIRIALDKRNEATRAIEGLKDELAELGPAAKAAGDDIERGLNLGAIGGAFASAGAASSIDSAVTASGRLRAQLGLTAEEAREFDAVAKEVYADNFGETMGEAAQATGLVHQALGLVGDDLRDATEDVFKVADAFEHLGADPMIIIEDLRAMKDLWPGADEAALLDMVTESFQRGTGGAGDLQDTLQEYPQYFSNIGLTATDMFRILDLGMENNARNTDVVADSFKEMALLVREEGSTAQVAIREMFPPQEAERLIADFAAGGAAGRDAFYSIIEAVNAAGTEQERTNGILAVFGDIGGDNANVIEDLIPQLVAMKDETREVGDATATLDHQYRGFRNSLEGITRWMETNALGSLGDVGLGFADVASNAGIAVLGLKGMRDMLPGLTGRLGLAATAAGGLAAALPGVFAAMNLQGNINAQGNDALSNFMERLPDARTADEFAANIDRMIGRYESLQDTANSGGPLFGALQEAYQNVNPNVPNIIADSESATRAFADAISSAMPQLEAWRENEEEVMRLTGMTADEVSALASTIGADLSGAGEDGSVAVGLLVDAYESGVGPADDLTGATNDLEASISGVIDATRAQLDPIWAAQDALRSHKDAQDAVKQAQAEAIWYQAELTEAVRKYGDDSPEAAEAARNLMDAQIGVNDANREVTRSAADVDAATYRLAEQMRTGNVDIAAAEEQLREWVTQGLITEDQAWQTAEELRGTASAADSLGGKNIVIPVDADTSRFLNKISGLYQNPSGFLNKVSGLYGGGQTRHGGGVIHGDPGQEVDVRALAGEYVIRAPAAEALGYDQLERLNRADQAPAMLTGSAVAAPVVAGGGDRTIHNYFNQHTDNGSAASILAWELAS